jgi:glycosyltransferase involved in cell wall biosynthesis
MITPTTSAKRRLKILTWHVHGTYLYYLTQANCDFYLPINADSSNGYGGKGGAYRWGDNVYEVPVEQLPNIELDAILFQSRQHYLVDQYEIFSGAQLALPKIYLEHDPPREHPTDTRHIVDDPSVIIVHVTDFNRLMWDSNRSQTAVIDHGVVVPPVRYKGTLEKGVGVINNLRSRGRRLGWDLFEYLREEIPLDLIGMGSQEIGGLGEVPHNELPEFISQYRFFLNPIRYTSLGLSLIEAMMVGLPVVGFATTELVSVFDNGVNGFISLKPNELIAAMRKLLDSPELARQVGAAGQQYAFKRFSISRFARDWEQLFEAVTAGHSLASPVTNHHSTILG